MRRPDPAQTASIAPTPELFAKLLEDRLPCWTWAAFASVLFQRWAVLEGRKVDQVLETPVRPVGRLRTSRDVARFVMRHLRCVDDVVDQVAAVLKSPTVTAALGASDDEGSADADAIVRSAHLLGDCYERLLEVAEECRRYAVPTQHVDLIRDCVRFANRHLDDFGGFINDVLERLEREQDRVTSGQAYVSAPPLEMTTTTDEDLVWALMDRLQAIE